jgi:Leucine-rich repeat (LRR) protein
VVLAQTTPNEKSGLISLYNSTGGPTSWINKWDITTDPCINSWFGVSCRPIGGNQYNVWRIVLQGNNMAGTLPTAIGLLTFLQFFYLSGNSIGGTLPVEIGNLVQLVQLGLDKNQMTGGFPDSLSKLGGLQVIYFQNNLLTGPIDNLAKLPAIQYLWLSQNTIKGTIPTILGDIFTLQQIGLNDNQFTGTVPTGFGTKQNLFQAFYGQRNLLTGAFPTHLCASGITCDLTIGNVFDCPIPTPTCCGVTTCKTP